MRKIVHAELYATCIELPKLMTDWSSCVRFAYNRFRDGLDFNDVRVAAKEKYPSLNTRQVSDAVTEAKGKHERTKDQDLIVFGGKKLFAQVCSGQVSAEQWRFVRDGMIYARGDRTKRGNPNLRIIDTPRGYELRVTVGHRDFRRFPLFVPEKLGTEVDDLLASGVAYNVRLRGKDEEKYRVVIDYEVDSPPVIATRRNGVIGVDTNPDRIAICFVAPDGNRVWSKTLINTRMFYGSTDKAKHEIALLVKEIVGLALGLRCAVAAENLKFKPKFVEGWRKSNRMKSRFVWRAFLTLLERKCRENGIEFHKVNPAYTSIQGCLKYQQMFNVPVHEAAAYVIGRRAMRLNEKVSIYRQSSQAVRTYAIQTLLEANGGKMRRFHSWALWRVLANVPVLTGHPPSLLSPRELGGSASNGGSGGGNPPRES